LIEKNLLKKKSILIVVSIDDAYNCRQNATLKSILSSMQKIISIIGFL